MERFAQASLIDRHAGLRRDARTILAVTLDVVDARRLLRSALEQRPPSAAPTFIVAAGKAGWPMLTAYVDVRGDGVIGAIVAAPAIPASVPGNVRAFRAGHPVPTDESAAAATAALEAFRTLPHNVERVVLLSGGASSLLAAPLPPLTLGHKIDVTSALLRAGAPIDALNCVRKHLSRVKGGRLAEVSPTSIETYAISDVVWPRENDPSVIGSGPTVADPSTFDDALLVIDRYLGDACDPVVRDVLLDGRAGRQEETPKPSPSTRNDRFTVIGSRHDALKAASAAARDLGYRTVVLEPAVVGEARRAGPRLVAGALRAAGTGSRPVCIVSGGETTVTVRGRGRGGRNQELVLAALERLSQQAPAVLVSIGTDGIDGPTAAAGAMADAQSLARAHAAGLTVEAALADNASYEFFAAIGDLVTTGPTSTNVADLQLLLLG